jgi:Tfp pilus assembly protein PilN
MMRRIELLPASHLDRRQHRRALATVVLAGLLLLLLVAVWWFMLGLKINDARDELARARARNRELQAEIDSLQRFAQLEAEVRAKQQALTQVMAGDVDWPGVLSEVAMVIPGEVWLTNMTASAGQTEGATTVGTETAPVRINERQPFGRIQFTGRSLSMSGVARWLVRLGSVREFVALWLNSANETTTTTVGIEVVDFDSTLEMSDAAASRRFQDGAP